jgi:hypothetical protein
MTTGILNPFGLLASTAQIQAQTTQKIQLAAITNSLQNEVNRKIAVLQGSQDQVSINLTASRIKALTAQQGAYSAVQSQYGNNTNNLGDLGQQLIAATVAANNGDNQAFDDAITAANTDLSNLTPATYNAIFQPDGITQLKANGLSVDTAASYDLSTPEGQAAAVAAVTAAANLVQPVSAATSANQTLAGSKVQELNGQVNALQTLQSQTQNASSAAITAQIAQLQTNMQNQIHLIQLNLSKTSQLAQSIISQTTPIATQSSAFSVLASNATLTAGTNSAATSSNAILSLFA